VTAETANVIQMHTNPEWLMPWITGLAAIGMVVVYEGGRKALRRTARAAGAVARQIQRHRHERRVLEAARRPMLRSRELIQIE